MGRRLMPPSARPGTATASHCCASTARPGRRTSRRLLRRCRTGRSSGRTRRSRTCWSRRTTTASWATSS
jgi:hypothetical protein